MTGVQTCALPIYAHDQHPGQHGDGGHIELEAPTTGALATPSSGAAPTGAGGTPAATPVATVQHRFEFDGLSIEHLQWQLPFGPPTEALFLKPAGAKGKLPGVVGLHDHGGNKYFGVRKITRHCSERIARRAFELAMTRRKKVTAIHKVNSFHMTDGLFMEAVRHVAQDFPDVALDDLLVDASTAHLVKEPERFDVLVATNFFGDILSDLASELAGSLGLAGSIMAGDNHCCAQAQHGSAPTLAGLDIANPTSMILSVAMLVRWLGDKRGHAGLQQAGDAMSAAVDQVLMNPQTRTRDIGGNMGCKAFGDAVALAIARA